jgi:hypothetical protein
VGNELIDKASISSGGIAILMFVFFPRSLSFILDNSSSNEDFDMRSN